MKTFQTYITEGKLQASDMSPRTNYREKLVNMIKAGDPIKLQKGGPRAGVVMTYANKDVKKVLSDKLNAQKEISGVGWQKNGKGTRYQFKAKIGRTYYKLTDIMKFTMCQSRINV